MTLHIRAATADDAPTIAELGRELNLHQGDPVEHFTPAAVRRDGFGEAPQFNVLVAERDGRILGYALFCDAYESSYAARGLYLCDLYVRPQARRHGIGRALMAAVASAAKARDKSFVWWASKPWNSGAQAFYRALGARDEPVLAHVISDRALESLAEGSNPAA